MSRLDLIVFFFKKSDFVLLSFLWFLIYLSVDPLTVFHDSSSLPSSPLSPSSSSLHHFSRSRQSSLVGATKPHKPILQSDRIEDVDATRLFRMIEEHDYLAVFFCEYSEHFCVTICANNVFVDVKGLLEFRTRLEQVMIINESCGSIMK